MNMQIKADLHVHTVYSNDSIITPKDLVFFAKNSGLNAVAVTDHNQVDGAKKIARETGFLVIPGTEVSSRHGHIVGLNVSRKIPQDLDAEETVDLIHKAGGIAIACHPFVLFKGCIGKHVTSKFDAVEAINSSAFPFGSATRKAKTLAEQLKLPQTAGTDAHYGPIIGTAYAVIDAEPNVESIVKAIKNGQCRAEGKPISWMMRFQNQGRFLKKYIQIKGKNPA